MYLTACNIQEHRIKDKAQPAAQNQLTEAQKISQLLNCRMWELTG